MPDPRELANHINQWINNPTRPDRRVLAVGVPATILAAHAAHAARMIGWNGGPPAPPAAEQGDGSVNPLVEQLQNPAAITEVKVKVGERGTEQEQTYYLCRYDTVIDEQNEEQFHKTFSLGEMVTRYRIIPDTQSCGQTGEIADISFVTGTDGREGEPSADGMFPSNLIDASWFDTDSTGRKTFRQQDFVDTIVKPMIHTTESVKSKMLAAGLDFPNVPIYVADLPPNVPGRTIWWRDEDPDHLCVSGNEIFIKLNREFLRNTQTVSGQEQANRAADVDLTDIGALAHEYTHAWTDTQDIISRADEPAAEMAFYTELDASPYRRTDMNEIRKAEQAAAFYAKHNTLMLSRGDELGYELWVEIASLCRDHGIHNYAEYLARKREVARADPTYCQSNDYNYDLLPAMFGFTKEQFIRAMRGKLSRSTQEPGSVDDDLFRHRRQLKDQNTQNYPPGSSIHLEPGDFFFLRYTLSEDPDSYDALVGTGIEAGFINSLGHEQRIPLGANIRTLMDPGRDSLVFVVLNPADEPIELTMHSFTQQVYGPYLSH